MDQRPQPPQRQNDKQVQRKLQRPRRIRTPKNQFRNDDDFNWGKVLRVVLSWAAILFGLFIVMMLFRTQDIPEYPLEFTQYQTLLKEGRIKDADIRKSELNNYDFHGTLKQKTDLQTLSGKTVPVEKFVITLPYIDGTVVKEWNDQGINFKITKEDNSWMNMLLNALPWVLLLVVWLIIMRRMQGVGTK